MNQIIRNGFRSILEDIFSGLELYKLSSSQSITVEMFVATLIFFKTHTHTNQKASLHEEF